MPTVPTHALAGLGVGALLAPGPMPWPFHALNLALGMLPDLDVVGFYLGVPYGSRYGHRGLSHSLLLALPLGLVAALAAGPALPAPWWWLWGCFFAALA